VKTLKSTLVLAPLCLTLVSCGSDSSGIASSVVSNGITELVSEVRDAVNGASGVLDSSSKRAFHAPLYPAPVQTKSILGSAWGADWSTVISPGTPFRSPATDSNVSAMDYIGDMLDDDLYRDNGSAASVFTRINSTMNIFCAIGVGATLSDYTVDDSGYLADGSYTITFTTEIKEAMESTCDMDLTGITTGSTVSFTVSDPGTNYDKKFEFTSMFDQVYMVKNDNTVTRIANWEQDTDEDIYSRALIEINKTTNVARGEYISTTDGSSNGVEVLRIYFDEDADEGQILSLNADASAVTNGTRFIIQGKPETGDAMSISLRADQQMGDTNSYEACVDSEDGSIITTGGEVDGTRCTTGARLGGADISTVNGDWGTFYSTYVGVSSDAADWGIAGVNDSKVVPFTDMTDMLTVDFTP
jgi:hypothetical protein